MRATRPLGNQAGVLLAIFFVHQTHVCLVQGCGERMAQMDY